jgi:very-short-patch-repair endonuclease
MDEMNGIRGDDGIPPLSPLDKGGSVAGGIFDRDALRKRGLVWNGKNLPYNPENVTKARELRKNMTPQERKLWYEFLRTYPIRFIRQRPIDHYILDFYCAGRRIAIEIDGTQHSTTSGEKYDRQRSEILSIYKIRVIRFTNKEIDEQFEAVCERICKEIPPYKVGREAGDQNGKRGIKKGELRE